MRVLWLSALIVVIDQITKVLVHFTMYRGQSIPIIGRYFRFTYTENPGMAFGLEFGPRGTITVFAIVASGLIVYYLWQIRGVHRPYSLGLALILGGAVGNIIDRVFYGALFYGEPLFLGRVIDFIHFDLFRGTFPDWVPFVGGGGIALFPIGNIADLAILAGVATVLLVQGRFHDAATAATEAAERAEGEEQGADATPSTTGPEAQPDVVTTPATPSASTFDEPQPVHGESERNERPPEPPERNTRVAE